MSEFTDKAKTAVDAARKIIIDAEQRDDRQRDGHAMTPVEEADFARLLAIANVNVRIAQAESLEAIVEKLSTVVTLVGRSSVTL